MQSILSDTPEPQKPGFVEGIIQSKVVRAAFLTGTLVGGGFMGRDALKDVIAGDSGKGNDFAELKASVAALIVKVDYIQYRQAEGMALSRETASKVEKLLKRDAYLRGKAGDSE